MLVAALSLMTPSAAAQGDQQTAAIFNRCVGCHGMPDTSLEGDRLWVKRIATTACVQPPAPRAMKKRGALMSWLRSAEASRPPREEGARAARKGEGLVTSSIEAGSILLVPQDHQDGLGAVRLVWTGGKKARAVRAGRYVVRNYKIFRKDDKGVLWQTWASGKGREVTVTTGKSTKIDLDLRVHITTQARQRKGKLSVGVQVRGDSRMGLTVIHAGDRVPALYVIEGADGALSNGSLKYG